VTAELRA
jgi:hypothetical protein